MRRIELEAGWQRIEIVLPRPAAAATLGSQAESPSAALGSNRIGRKPTAVDHCFPAN